MLSFHFVYYVFFLSSSFFFFSRNLLQTSKNRAFRPTTGRLSLMGADIYVCFYSFSLSYIQHTYIQMLKGLEIKDLDELKDKFHPRTGVYPYYLIDENFRTSTFEAARSGHGKGILGDRKRDDSTKLQAIVDPSQETTIRIVFTRLCQEKDFESEKKTPVVDIIFEVDNAFKELNCFSCVASSRWLSKYEKKLPGEKDARVGLLVFRTSSSADEAFESLKRCPSLQVFRGIIMVHSSLEEILKDFNNTYVVLSLHVLKREMRIC